MTTTESRPAYLDPDDQPPIPEPMPMADATRGPRKRGRLGRSLPYAIAALTLAVGYAVGHSTNNPQPKQVPIANVVTPGQINAALSGTSGQPIVNDFGFSKLENGVQPKHGFQLPVGAKNQALLNHQMQLARETALKYPTLKDAVAAGMWQAGPFSPGLGTHMIMTANFAYGAGKGVMTDAQITHPMAWIYDGTKPDSKVAGLFYQANVQNPAGFAGPNDYWHAHSNICIVNKPGGGLAAPLGADREGTTTAECDAVGGTLIKATGPLLHVWPVAGYEDVNGVSEHLNPAIRCNDGTYYTIPQLQNGNIGDVPSVCRDGTE